MRSNPTIKTRLGKWPTIAVLRIKPRRKKATLVHSGNAEGFGSKEKRGRHVHQGSTSDGKKKDFSIHMGIERPKKKEKGGKGKKREKGEGSH